MALRSSLNKGLSLGVLARAMAHPTVASCLAFKSLIVG
jgi:hypothetical protein